MKRDMELVRKILFAIEEKYTDTAIIGLRIEGYSKEEIAYHCKILHEAGLVSSYKAIYADNHISLFTVGSLTWDGNDYLDKIRSEVVWEKTKQTIEKKKLPMILEVVKDISSAIISSMVEGAIKGIK